VSWSGWPDLNRRPLRPEANCARGLPGLHVVRPGNDRPSVSAGVRGWRWRSLLSWLLGPSCLVTAGRVLSANGRLAAESSLGLAGEIQPGALSEMRETIAAWPDPVMDPGTRTCMRLGMRLTARLTTCGERRIQTA
jgi:hypothetical protein